MRTRIDVPRLFVAVIFPLLMLAAQCFGGVRSDYRSPTLVIPYTDHAPTIDGAINDTEWQSALSLTGLQTTEGNVSTRQTTFWLMWDDDHLYIAMRSPLRPGERPLQANRETGRDNSKVVFDDSYEIWLNANTKSPDGEPVLFQYLGNIAGAKYDVMFEPAVGNSRPGWESGWKPVGRITPDGKSWEWEVAIPRQSVYRDTPFTDGTQLSGLLIRNYKRPWEQNSTAGSGSFSVAETHCKYILSKTAPAIHLLGVCDPDQKSFGISLAAFSLSDQTIKWAFTSDGGVNTSDDLQIPAGKVTSINPQLNLDHPGDGYYRIKVTSSDGKTTYVDWSSRRAFGDFSATTQPVVDTGDKAELTLSFNPVRNYVRVEGDFINYDNRAAIASYSAEVDDAAGKPLVQKDLSIDKLAYVRGLLSLPDCPPGSYVAKLVCKDSSGKVMLEKESPFTKKDPKEFAWWNTKDGDIEKVIAPWTPVKHDGAKVDVWGRTMTIGAGGLPAQVSTQGKDILAGPIELQASNSNNAISLRNISSQNVTDTDHRVVVNAASKLGDIDIASTVTTEFDGMYKIDMKLTPTKAQHVNSLKVVIPIKPEFAQYFHACGEGIRYGFSYGYLPKDKTGSLWNSKQVDGQPMLVGSFIPYVWIGNEDGGLDWFADSDAGWTPDDKIPAIEIRRDSPDDVDLVLNLIGTDTTIDQPRNITFAFQATPVKPIRDGWRMETWSTGDTFQDFCRVEPKGGHLIWNALPFTLDPAGSKKMVQAQQAKTSEYLFGFPKYKLEATPYFENNGIDEKFAPEVAYFGDEWKTNVSSSLCFGKTLTDFIVWNLGQWTKQTGMDGWYVDNVRPVAGDNIDAGQGYRLPDGRIQPSYQMFATREHFLRVRAVFAENGKTGKFVLHMTNHMIMPWIGAADVALDGEDHVIFSEMGKDFIDFWSPTRMRLDYPKQSGVEVTFLEEYQGKWSDADIHRVMRAYSGMVILNDVIPGANPNGHNHETWIGRDRFGIESPDVTFVPYWDKDTGISCDGAGLYASAWKKPNSALIAIVNTGDATTASVHIDTAKLGLGASDQCKLIDAESGDPLPALQDGSMHIPIERHDYRQVMISIANAER
jgi:Family of unknown function (DUF6067)